MGFLSRVVSQYNEDLCVGSSILTSQTLPGNHTAPHSMPMLGGIQGLKAQKKFTLFKVYSFYLLAPACPFSPLERFPFAKKKLQLNLCRKEVLAFLILPGTNTSRTI